MKKIILLTLASFLFIVKPVFAQENFKSKLDSTYTVHEDGSTFVTHEFEIENLTPEYFISKYGLQLSSPNIKDVKVTSNNQIINAEVVNTDNQTSIGISFTDKIVGQHKKRKFIISYQNNDLSQLTGKVLEVTIPQLTDPNQYNQYNLTLITPEKYGSPTRITPSDFTQSDNNKSVFIHLNNLQGQGVSAIYGDTQVFDLSLRYFLENDRNQPVLMQFSLPPDTLYQKMHYHKIDPQPDEMSIDSDGNWIATYRMENYTNFEVNVYAQTQLTLEKNPNFPKTEPSDYNNKQQEFWQLNNETLKSHAQQYTSPQQIYDFTTKHLQYTKEELSASLKRLGALEAINNPHLATCQEYTDVFIALARINNIPSRRITGYAYTKNETLRPLSLSGDILHAWPEYYNQEQQSWTPIDPTWGSTTGGVDYFNQFDLNHIVFAINGKSSVIPHPAGAYKKDDHPSKNVEVKFSSQFPEIKPDLLLQIIPKKISFINIPGTYELKITNPTGQAWYHNQLNFLTNNPQAKIQVKQTQPFHILPFQTITVPFTVYNDKISTNYNQNITISIQTNNGQIIDHDFKTFSIPNASKLLLQPKFLTTVGIISVIITLIAGSILILGRKR